MGRDARVRAGILATLVAFAAMSAVWIWWPTSERPIPAGELEHASEEPTAGPRQASVPTVREASAARVQVEPNDRPPTRTDPEPITTESETYDPALTRSVTVRVEDPNGNPIVDAEVSFRGLRPVDSPGSWFGWRGDPPVGRTDPDGEVSLDAWVWTHPLSKSKEIHLEVEHPDYPTVDQDVPIDASPAVIVMQPGRVLSVSGWITSPTEAIHDLRILTNWRSELRDEDWERTPGLPPITRRAPNRAISLFLEHTTEGNQPGRPSVYFSDQVFVAADESTHLHLQLHPEVTIRGRLDERVPRPVIDGEVMATVCRESETNFGLHQQFGRKAPVDEQGNFEIHGLPRGFGQIIAACEGYRTSNTNGPRLFDAAVDDELPRWLDRSRNPCIHTRQATNLVVPMVPEAVARFTVLGPDGNPVANAQVAMWPNVSWPHSSQLFLQRSYRASTDESGVAILRGLPPGTESFRCSTSELVLPIAEVHGARRRQGKIELESGQTTDLTVRLERRR